MKIPIAHLSTGTTIAKTVTTVITISVQPRTVTRRQFLTAKLRSPKTSVMSLSHIPQRGKSSTMLSLYLNNIPPQHLHMLRRTHQHQTELSRQRISRQKDFRQIYLINTTPCSLTSETKELNATTLGTPPNQRPIQPLRPRTRTTTNFLQSPQNLIQLQITGPEPNTCPSPKPGSDSQNGSSDPSSVISLP